MERSETTETISHLSAAVIGAGFSGIGVGKTLRENGVDNFLIFDRGDTVGGTWRDNTYPGCSSDIPAVLYCYASKPNPDWKNTYATQPEVLEYLQRCSVEFGIEPMLRLQHELESANWDDVQKYWQIQTSKGSYTANTLFVCTGYLSEPNTPVFSGIDDFSGESFHTADWNHDLSLKGKRVAVIGNGASAIQLVPAIQADVAQLDLYQRTAPWVTPKPEKEIKGFTAWAIQNIPGYQRLLRESVKWQFETLAFALRRPFMMKQIQKFWGHDLKKYIDNPELRQRLQPDFVMGCKRILFSDTYYPALNHENVDVISEGIRRITATGIESGDGTHRPVDVIVFGTGFRANKLPIANRVYGRDGLRLSDAWKDGQVAHLGSAVSGYPNMFIVLGPGTTLSHTSMTLMIEAQLHYIGDYLRKIREQSISSVDVKHDKMHAYRKKLDNDVGGTVWSRAGGCDSWYRDEHDRNTTVWPNYAIKFQWLNRRFNTENFEITTIEQ
ncbi:MAG: flavin-containing monooxygenase [Granulosicoccus sp.]